MKLYDRMMLSSSSGVRHWLLSAQPLGARLHWRVLLKIASRSRSR